MKIKKSGYNDDTVTISVVSGKVTIADVQMVALGGSNQSSTPVISSTIPTDSSVTVTWGAVTGATSYNIYYAVGTTVTKSTGTEIPGASSGYVVTGLTKGTQYAFAVTAVVGGVESALGTSQSTVASNTKVYTVNVVIDNPQGQPQGGVTVTLQNPPFVSPIFSAVTDSLGRASVQAPAGSQTFKAQVGTLFTATITVTVIASTTPTQAPKTQLVQNTTLGKVLVVFAGCENIETILRTIGFSAFDSVTVDSLRSWSLSDSIGELVWLKQFSIVFSDCNCGDEGDYPELAYVYGRYINAGGKIYGGHYNYYNLQYIFPPYFQTPASLSVPGDTLVVLDTTLKSIIGAKVQWVPDYPLTGYDAFTDLPPTAKVYGTINGTNPPVAAIVECHAGNGSGGKYLWTNYHNQDIENDANLVKIVQYFLLTM
jgi:hypothetical protein